VPVYTLSLLGLAGLVGFWAGAATGAGLRERRALPVAWGLLVGAASLYAGHAVAAGIGSWGGLAWLAVCFAGGGLAVGLGLRGLRSWLLRRAVVSLMAGTLIMAFGALLGAMLYQGGLEALSLILGGAGFLFGAMWFGSGLKQLRGK